MLRKGLFLADRYEVLEQVGTGGMSDVYKAKCHKLNRYVAIKVLKPEFSEDKAFVTKFREEAQSAAGLTHPNIVSVYDVGDEDGIYYIVMELVEGITLKKYIEKRGRIPYKEAVSIAIQVAKGMEAAHSHHIVHRDIKPQNIIISKDGKVKVTDFGIAKAATSSTINSSAMGSVHYISPEQARGGYSDERSDIYSFGITLFEMLTGKVPFDGDTTVSVALQHIQDEIPAPSELVTDEIPVGVDKIVLKCTQKKTEMRYQAVSELITDLKKSLVIPEVDFVNMAPSYNTNATGGRQENSENAPENEDDILRDDDDDESDDSLDDNLDDGLSDDDMLDDDLSDDYDNIQDDFDSPSRISYSKKEKKKKAPDGEDSEEKIDKIMKWIGIGIIGLILIITVVIVIKLMGSSKGNPSGNDETVSSTEATQDNKNLVEVPFVEGLTEEEAKKKLNEKGLGYKSSNQPSTTVEAGRVIQQQTRAGTMVEKNSTITLVISVGPESVMVPNVTGYKQAEATVALENVGLKVGSVQEEYSDTLEAGKVIRLDPQMGSSVEPGTKITMVVSKGKEKVTVPRLVGLTKDKALELLAQQGLEGEIVEVKDAAAPYGQVISQGYDPEEYVEKGTVVTITVSTNSSYNNKPTESETESSSTAAEQGNSAASE